ncbi:heparan-alpha-glucosaminide N-acetyltransferase [Aureimonas glaciei]|uniref:Heparan-alpha-glucosaminide N-acetyltransferase catalytic domain-containing protein n=1 Tax=Aureimonas glaciei TaxID=1776957 RepID=A0A916YC63_9HYPH|nr:heparan-alpha-glucosaminide N-acetyltransferase [Aureimonas glaciei]GGD39165.1 hypothetical protein GCM10011335_47420 [Aureimonas glaciei]
MTPGETESARPEAVVRRIDALDIARGVALIAMAIYHFTWDLENFGYVDHGLTAQGGWKLFARCIASSFLFLVGVSLVLAHARGIRWRSFWRRWLGVALGAAAITLVTFYVTPQGFVFFGILHEIALASLLGLAFLGLPFPVTALVALAVIALPQFVTSDLLDPKALAWIGMAAKPPVSNDFVPLFPWFGAVLLGIAAAQAGRRFGAFDRLRLWNQRLGRAAPLAWLGRHSLLFYLLHQPLLFGLVAATAQVYPPDPARILQSDCRRGCMAERQDAAFCSRYCSCISDRLVGADLLERLLAQTTTETENAAIGDMVLACSAPRP